MDEINNITNVIRTKDRELQKIQDLRFSQLEKTIEERDQLLLESCRRFERLKNHFQYNLRLLEARDREISRMESILEKHGRDREEVDQQVRNLLSRIDCMEKMDKERTEKFEQEKTFNKVIDNLDRLQLCCI
jgi:DNA repair ATPase RecN